MASEEWSEEDRVEEYLAAADGFPHRSEGEGVLLDHVPRGVQRVLDLGTGDGRLLTLLSGQRPNLTGVGLEISEPMLRVAEERLREGGRSQLIRHDLDDPLPDLGSFDAVVSSFAIHHLEDERKRSLLSEVFAILKPGGVFANLEHVASPTERLHLAFFKAIKEPIENEDPSDRTVAVETQLGWLRETGFTDVDCYWKWLEMALLIGVKPSSA